MTLLRFCAVGILNTLVGLTLIFLLMRFIGFNYVIANAAGYAIGFVMSFFLNRAWTFQHKGSIAHSAMLWMVVVGFAYASNLAVIVVAHSDFGVNQYAAQVLGVATYTALSFLGGRYYVFQAADV